MPRSPTSGSHLLALDSHIHLHDISNLPGLLDSTVREFRKAIGQQMADRPFLGMLVLTEPRTRPTFASLRHEIKQSTAAGKGTWTLTGTEEAISLRATHSGGDTLFLTSGQQIVTRENLEVLALLVLPEVPDGLSLAETVTEIVRLGGLAVLPWGVGKWLGTRGRIVSNFLDKNTKLPVFLGDNGGRPSFWKSIPQFRQAKKAGIPILRGSDPLHCSHRRRGAGSYGNLLTCQIDMQQPGKSVRAALTNMHSSPAEFGKLEQPWHFCKDQLTLRIS